MNGSGKTTSIAKLSQYLKDQGNTILLAACDTFRAAAADQLSIWADRAGCEIVKGAPGADPASVAHDACQRHWPVVSTLSSSTRPGDCIPRRISCVAATTPMRKFWVTLTRPEV